MEALAQPVNFKGEMMRVALANGRVVGVPLVWFTRLTGAMPNIGADGRGLRWNELDEDWCVAGLLAGADWRGA